MSENYSEENKDQVNEKIKEVQSTTKKALDELNNEELRDKMVNLEVENQNMKDELNKLKELNKNKDNIISSQQSQINLYVNKYNKDEITIDALQDKLLTILSTYNK